MAGSHGAELSPLLELDHREYQVKKGIYKDYDSYSGFFSDGKEVELQRILERIGAKEVVVCGLAFDFCVGSTALDAKKLGYEVSIIEEATKSVTA